MDNANKNKKVTIDAAYFAELYATAQQYDVAARTVASLAKERDELMEEISRIKTSDDVAFARMRGDCDAIRKERDELKAKLAEHAELLQRTEAERVALKAKLAAAEKSVESLDAAFCNDERLAAAERCIEEVSKWIGEPNWIVDSRASRVIREIIRAYRAQKEAK